MRLLTVAISTVKSERDNVLEKINNLSGATKDLLDFLVVSQFEDEYQNSLIGDIRVVKLTGKGLSKSRNLAIQETSTEWIWFQDDDFSINENELSFLVSSLSNGDIDIALIRIGSLENSEKYYKNYVDYSKYTRLLSLKVSSIEIIARVSFIRDKEISFNEKLGLGTELPCCEENQFMLDSFDRGANINFLNRTLCYHTTLAENRKIDYVKNLKAKGYFLRRLPAYISLLLIFKWAFTLNTNFSFFQNIKLLTNGFLLNERIKK
ncbi:glycosyltransferase [Pseudoalteromonas neustonica]|uniref:glycosyltransferase n=1 Tax=Pseudoalteromonas neustonica TaxID=1840331 RepID=UPI0007DB188A|nr:glycosyltransferase [Pseudoalteromonas neustonica]